MYKKLFVIFLLFVSLIFSNPVYSKDVSTRSIEKYLDKVSSKFSRTFCNTYGFGISEEGALEFAIGETKKEFSNNNLNQFIDYSLLKNKIFKSLDENCQVYDFPTGRLEELKLK